MAISRKSSVAVIDDDDAVRDSTCTLLEAFGHAIASFASAADFLADSRVADFDCLLLDLPMPGMSGIELLEALKARGIATPVIILTGNGGARSPRLGKENVTAVLRKPAASDALLQAVTNALAPKQN